MHLFLTKPTVSLVYRVYMQCEKQHTHTSPCSLHLLFHPHIVIFIIQDWGE